MDGSVTVVATTADAPAARLGTATLLRLTLADGSAVALVARYNPADDAPAAAVPAFRAVKLTLSVPAGDTLPGLTPSEATVRSGIAVPPPPPPVDA